MSKNYGKLYALTNPSFFGLIKCGVSGQLIQKRVQSIQTSLPIDCNVISTTDVLLYPYFYEKILKQMLSKYRFRNNREFYSISESDVIHIFSEFNLINKILCTEVLILNYIKNNDLKYYNYIIKKNNKIIIESNSNSSNEFKKTYSFSKIKSNKRRIIFIDTSNL